MSDAGVITLAQTDDQIASCFPVMRELRPHIASEAEFVARVRVQLGEGFLLAALREGSGPVAACAGFRVYSNLFCGRHLYVDDLVTLATERSRGHGRTLLRRLKDRATGDACEMLILDSGVQRFGAHRFYLREGFDIVGHHFADPPPPLSAPGPPAPTPAPLPSDPMEMTPDRWARTRAYLCEVFGREEPALRALMPRAIAQGLPDIAVDAAVGRLLTLLCSTTNGGRGARLAVELGTLAGYSGVWIARGLAPGGRLITVEPERKHAEFAQRTFAELGVADRVEIRRGFALEEIGRFAKDFGPGSIDFAFLDAVKPEYPAYFEALRDLIAPRGLLVADNALGGSWWIDETGERANPDREKRETRDAVDRFNRMAAADSAFETACVPLREGLTIARKR